MVRQATQMMGARRATRMLGALLAALVVGVAGPAIGTAPRRTPRRTQATSAPRSTRWPASWPASDAEIAQIQGARDQLDTAVLAAQRKADALRSDSSQREQVRADLVAQAHALRDPALHVRLVGLT